MTIDGTISLGLARDVRHEQANRLVEICKTSINREDARQRAMDEFPALDIDALLPLFNIYKRLEV